MIPYFADDSTTLYGGDALDVLASLPDDSVDAVVTDPPYGLAFMGKAWDTLSPSQFQAWCEKWSAECLRVLKPGGHLLAFGGTRTYHRLACAVEDAGFEIRDSITWLYGSGFPKSLDVGKAIDKARTEDLQPAADVAKWLVDRLAERKLGRRDVTEHFGAANIAQQWTTHWIDGAVKPRVPRWEQWQELKRWLALSDDMDAEVWRLNGRKGTPGEAWGQREVIGERTTGIGTGCGAVRIIGDGNRDITAPATEAAQRWHGWGTALKPASEPIVVARKPLVGTVALNVQRWDTGALNIDATRPGGEGGRWPANVLLDECVAEQLGELAQYFPTFHYQAKAPSRQRPKLDDGTSHPTVKPLDLMQWLVRLVTPPNGTVLDPFAGSGTTLEAAILEGLTSIGIERDPQYLQLCEQRLSKQSQPDLFAS